MRKLGRKCAELSQVDVLGWVKSGSRLRCARNVDGQPASTADWHRLRAWPAPLLRPLSALLQALVRLPGSPRRVVRRLLALGAHVPQALTCLALRVQGEGKAGLCRGCSELRRLRQDQQHHGNSSMHLEGLAGTLEASPSSPSQPPHPPSSRHTSRRRCLPCPGRGGRPHRLSPAQRYLNIVFRKGPPSQQTTITPSHSSPHRTLSPHLGALPRLVSGPLGTRAQLRGLHLAALHGLGRPLFAALPSLCGLGLAALQGLGGGLLGALQLVLRRGRGGG